ncbi:MAG: hypothetical protein AABX23_02715 [Nanoarchaeota archaeon]
MNELEDKARETERILREWVELTGHNRCWWHPELLQRLGKLYDVDMSKAIERLPIEVFRRGCAVYTAGEYGLPRPDGCEDIRL